MEHPETSNESSGSTDFAALAQKPCGAPIRSVSRPLFPITASIAAPNQRGPRAHASLPDVSAPPRKEVRIRIATFDQSRPKAALSPAPPEAHQLQFVKVNS